MSGHIAYLLMNVFNSGILLAAVLGGMKFVIETNVRLARLELMINERNQRNGYNSGNE